MFLVIHRFLFNPSTCRYIVPVEHIAILLRVTEESVLGFQAEMGILESAGDVLQVEKLRDLLE